MKRTALLAAILLAGCKEKPKPPVDDFVKLRPGDTIQYIGELTAKNILAHLKPCPEAEANRAAFLKVSPLLNHLDYHSKSGLAQAERTIECLRPWALKLKDDCQRAAIREWLDYYNDRAREGRADLAKGDPDDVGMRLMKAFQAENVKALAWEEKHPFPPMPQCEDK